MSLRSQREIPGIFGQSDRPLLAVFATDTPDRTLAIQGWGPSPLSHLQVSIELLASMGASVVGIPCNTAHYFLRGAVNSGAWVPPVPLVDMIDETAKAAARSGVRTAGLLATSGTISTGLYQQSMARVGIRVLVPAVAGLTAQPRALDDRDESDQEVEALVARRGEQDGLVMEAIYGEGGIKAGFTEGRPRRLLEAAGRRLVQEGAEALVLGCTEIPLALRGSHLGKGRDATPLFDSTGCLASALRGSAGTIGIAGGLGPEATIDLIAKLEAPASFLAALTGLFQASLELLRPARDQEHPRMYAAALPDPADAAVRLKRAGATVLVPAPGLTIPMAEIERATGLPTLSGPVPELFRSVVQMARPAYA